jgi:putative tricarboxylic transport membrane protein
MVDLFQFLSLGFSVAFSIENLGLVFLGCLLGTLIGVLPGVGPLATFAMLLPVTYYLPPIGALIMLSGVYYGAQYGGSTTAILVNIPGEASSVVTCLDGHQMARQGRGGAALATAALASLFAGCVVTLLIALAGPPLVQVALMFGPAEYVAMISVGLISAVLLAHGSIAKSAAMVIVGILIGVIGTDINTGDVRYDFGFYQLSNGIDFVPVAMGIFALAEIVANFEASAGRGQVITEIKRLWPSRDDFRRSWKPTLRGTALGAALGILPGGGATVSSFAAYALEKKISKTPERFGTGAIEGVAGPEAANNAGAQATFIPMLTLGIPPNGLMALMMGAMITHGITPGPQIMTKQPDLFWGMIVSMWIGNVMLVALNLPLIGIWVKLLKIRYAYLAPAVILLCAMGTYSVNSSSLDVILMAMFGLLGYMFRKFECPAAPLLLGLVLGPQLEEQLRRALLLSDGNWSVFAERPISLGFLLVGAALMVMIALPAIRKKREIAFQEED